MAAGTYINVCMLIQSIIPQHFFYLSLSLAGCFSFLLFCHTFLLPLFFVPRHAPNNRWQDLSHKKRINTIIFQGCCVKGQRPVCTFRPGAESETRQRGLSLSFVNTRTSRAVVSSKSSIRSVEISSPLVSQFYLLGNSKLRSFRSALARAESVFHSETKNRSIQLYMSALSVQRSQAEIRGY